MTEATQPPDAGDVLYCAVHTNVETTLRCNKCGRPMCPRCAVQTPVGYRCKECVRGQQKTFYNAQTLDPIIQLVISLFLGLIGTGLIGLFELGGFFIWLIAFWAGSGFGALVADLCHRAVGKRRGKYSYLAVAAGIIVGGLIASVLPWAIAMGSMIALSGSGYEQVPALAYFGGMSLTKLIFLGMAVAGAVGRLRLGR
jgi:hypothetical protein